MLRYFDVDRRQWVVQQIDVRVSVQRASHVHTRLLALLYASMSMDTPRPHASRLTPDSITP